MWEKYQQKRTEKRQEKGRKREEVREAAKGDQPFSDDEVCLCVYVNVCVCICTHTRTHAHTAHAHTHKNTHAHTRMHKHVYKTCTKPLRTIMRCAYHDENFFVIVMKLYHDEITPRWVFTVPDSWYRVGPGLEPVQTRLFWVARTTGSAAICRCWNCGLKSVEILCIVVHCARTCCASTAPYVLRDRYLLRKHIVLVPVAQARVRCILWYIVLVPIAQAHCACTYCASTASYVLRDSYGVASVSRIDEIIGLFCKRAL